MKTLSTVAVAACAAACMMESAVGATDDITLETEAFRLVIGADAKAKPLVVKTSGEECLDLRDGTPMFATVQERPFNNEVKLMRPNKRYVFPASRVRREGDRLPVGFETVPYEAVLKVKTGSA